MFSTQAKPLEGIRKNNEVPEHEDSIYSCTSTTDILNSEACTEPLNQSDGILDIFKCADQTNDTQTVNPLMIQLILEKLMRMLSLETLTKARLVSSTWNNHALTQIRFRHKSINLTGPMEFNEVMMNTLNFPFVRFKFPNLGEEVFQFMDNFGDSLTEVSLSTYGLTPSELSHVLTACKNLERLKMKVTLFSSNENFIFADTKQHQIPSLKCLYLYHSCPNPGFLYLKEIRESDIPGGNLSLFKNFFQLTPNLKSIQFDYDIGDYRFVGKMFQVMDLLPKFPVQNLQELKIYGRIFEDEIKTLQNCSLRFKSLCLGNVMTLHSNTPFLTEFLECQRDSLAELWIDSIALKSQRGVQNENSNPHLFCFPIMPKLKIFGMKKYCVLSDSTYRSYLVNFQLNSISSTFPKLQNLYVYDPYVYKFLNGGASTETIQEFGILFRDVYDDDDEDNSPDYISRVHHFRENILGIRDMFPNLKILSLSGPNSRWTVTVFDVLINLTELNISRGHFVEFSTVDTVFTGIQEEHCSYFLQGGELATAKPVIETYLGRKYAPGLCDLKNLRKLKLHLLRTVSFERLSIEHSNYERIQRTQAMTDATGYLALLQMKPLEKLEICDSSAQFSDHCIAALTSHHREVKFFPSNAKGQGHYDIFLSLYD